MAARPLDTRRAGVPGVGHSHVFADASNCLMAQSTLSVPFGTNSPYRPDTIFALLAPMAAQVAFIEWMKSVEKRSKSEAFWADLHKARFLFAKDAYVTRLLHRLAPMRTLIAQRS